LLLLLLQRTAVERQLQLRRRGFQLGSGLEHEARRHGNDQMKDRVRPPTDGIGRKEPARHQKDQPQFHKQFHVAAQQHGHRVGQDRQDDAHLIAEGAFVRGKEAVAAIEVVDQIGDKKAQAPRGRKGHEGRADVNQRLVHPTAPVFGAVIVSVLPVVEEAEGSVQGNAQKDRHDGERWERRHGVPVRIARQTAVLVSQKAVPGARMCILCRTHKFVHIVV